MRRHATTLRSAISITVLGIAVLLIRCARCLVWIPFVVPAPCPALHVTRAASYPSFSRSGMRLSRRDIIAAAGDNASLLALSRRALICTLFPFLNPYPVLSTPYPPFFMKVAGPRARVPITSPLGRRGPGVASVPSIWSELLPTHAMWRAVVAGGAG